MKTKCIVAFAGHMIDHPERLRPRFPPWAEQAVRSQIRDAIRDLSPIAAVSSAACGGDILFAEEILEIGVPLFIILPFQNVDDFIRESVAFAGQGWVERFRAVCRRAAAPTFFVKPGGYNPDDKSVFEVCQYTVLFFGLGFSRALGIELESLILHDDTQKEDGPGGTESFLKMCLVRGIRHRLIHMAAIRQNCQDCRNGGQNHV